MRHLAVDADLDLAVDAAAGEHGGGRLTGHGHRLRLEFDRPEMLVETADRATLRAVVAQLTRAQLRAELYGPGGRIAVVDPAHESSSRPCSWAARTSAWTAGGGHSRHARWPPRPPPWSRRVWRWVWPRCWPVRWSLAAVGNGGARLDQPRCRPASEAQAGAAGLGAVVSQAASPDPRSYRDPVQPRPRVLAVSASIAAPSMAST